MNPYIADYNKAYDSPSGFALRRDGACGDAEKDCGMTLDGYHRCCPGSTECSSTDVCCPTAADCRAALLDRPHCALNSTWTLFDQEDGFFCCLNGQTGFRNGNHTGCSDGPAKDKEMIVLLPVVQGSSTRLALRFRLIL